MTTNPFTLIVRAAVLFVGLYLIVGLAVNEFNSLSGTDLLASGQHLIAGLAFLAGGLICFVLVVAPQALSAVLQFIVHLGRV